MVCYPRPLVLQAVCGLLLLTLTHHVMSESLSRAERSSNCPRVQSNGCSVPLNGPFPYKKVFKPACNKHDVCYYCGQLLRWSKSACDKAFKEDMYARCRSYASGRKKRWWLSKAWKSAKLRSCRLAARTYHGAVIVAGSRYYVKKSPSWCRQRCVKPLGRP